MKRVFLLLIGLALLFGWTGSLGDIPAFVSKFMLQVIIPLGAVVVVNRKDYWFHHSFRKLDRFNRFGALVFLFYFLSGSIFDYVGATRASMFLLPLYAIVVLSAAFCFWRIFLDKGLHHFHRFHFGRISVYLLFHMFLWGTYAMGVRELGGPSAINAYATTIQVISGFTLVTVFFLWGKRDHKVDPPTVEGMVRKLR